MTVFKWSTTAITNDDVDSTINWQEGQSPGSINGSARAMMAAIAKWRDDLSGNLVTGGTSTAYTLTTNQGFTALTDGLQVAARMSATSGASPTLAVDGLTAKAIADVYGTAIPTGALRSGSIQVFSYDSTDDKWIVNCRAASEFAAATAMLFVQTAAPTGWTKSTSHNDKALRIVSGTAASGGSTAFSSVFAARTIAQANLPNVSFTITGTAASHTHTASAAGQSRHGSGGANVGTSWYGCDGDVGGTSSTASLTTAASGTLALTGTAASGGSGTALDFAVQYLDTIMATKD